MADSNLMEGNGGPESVFRSVADAEVSLDEMLSLACRQGKQDIVELLLESGAKVNYRNKAGNTPLLEACSQGHVNIACLLLERNADIDAPTETTSDSALTWACTLGNEEIVQLLLEHKASIEHRTRDGCTALMFAALAGHENVARLLLDHGAKLNVESDSNKDSPLTFACWKGHQRVVELFLAHKANIEHRTKEGFSPLMFAALGGHTEVARLLLEKKAEVNNPSGSNNDIPLTSACWKGHHAVVELLLQYNSNIEHHTKDGCTPLMLAAREGHLSVAQLLLNHNAKVNVPSGSENNIPLTLACWKGHRDVVELLLQYNSNIEHQNKAGCTPLMLAAREGHFEATDLLLDCHAQLNVPSGSNDDTPLTLACWKGHEGVVGLLLEKQSSINHQTKTGCTPLMEATREGHVGVARMLLEAGADVETPDNYGQTPFFMACWKGHAEVASLLLEYGANKDCRTKTGITPFFQACRENHVEVVKLLLDYGCNPSSPFPNSRECPLTLAAEKGFTELTQVLISRNANMECRTKKGCTPFYLTCKEGYQGIAVMLVKHGANTEATDQRGITPLLAAFRNGHVEVVDWLLGHVAHLPSDLDCQKALLAPKLTDKEVFPNRSKCLELIMKAKKAREQAALKNAQSLFEELDAEKEKEETKRKAAARRRHKRKEKKKNKQFEKNAEPDIDPKEFEDEEEEDFTARPSLLQPPSVETTLEREEAPPILPTPTRKLSKKRGKKNQGSDSGLATPTLGSTTSVTRTSLQTPATSSHGQCTDSWGEEEESGDDEMFVDAPSEFIPDGSRGGSSNPAPSSPKNCNGSSDGYRKVGGGSGRSTRDQKVESSSDARPVCSLLPRSNKNGKRSKSLKDEVKGGGGGGGVKRSGSQKVTKSEGNGGGGDLSVSSSNDGTAGATVQLPPTRSPREKKKKTGGGKKSPDPPPTTTANNNNNDKKRSESAWRESPVLVRDEDDWDNNLLEPSLDWSNDNNQQPFIPNTCSKVNRTKSWSSVTTATPSVSLATNSAPPSSAANSSSGGSNSNSKNWQEVSRAIKTHQLTVSNSLVGRIIGLKGAKINQIQSDSGAQISISRAIPRSVERLVTIKGTERSVVTAREMIEEALSTSNRDSDDLSLPNQSSTPSLSSPLVQNPAPPPLQSAPPLLATPPQITSSSAVSVSNPWGQPSLSTTSSNTTISTGVSSNTTSTTTTVWGQKSIKRYSDVVPPTSSSLQSSSTSDNNTETETPPISALVSARKLSLPASIPSSSAPPPTSLVAPLPTTASQSKSATSLTKETPAPEPVVVVTARTGSIPNSFLSIVQEEEESEEALKLKRSNSEPTNSVSFINPSSSDVVSSASSSSTKPTPQSLHPSQKFSPSMSPILSPSTPPPISPLSSVKVSTAPVSSVLPEAPQSPEPKAVLTVAMTPSTVGVTRANRMVGVVTPTQTVKPYQHETTPTQTLPSSSTITVTPSSGSHGNFGAIGPPNRRNSLPVSPHLNNHYDSNDFNNIRKFSYAGIPMVPPVGGSLGVVHESFPIVQRDYNWPPPPPMLNGPLPPAPPPPHHPPPPPHAHPPNPSYVPPNHIDWTGGGGGGNFLEQQERARSQSWAGLPPGNFALPGGTHDFPLPSGTGGANRSYFDGNDHMSHGPPPPQHSPGWGAKSFHPHHHQPPPPPPPPHRSHSYQFRPPPSYVPHPLRSTTGSYSNPGGNYYEHGNGLQTDPYHNWAPTPLPAYHQSHKSQQGGSEPISLKQVLGEKLEQEIFPGEGGSAGLSSADFSSKDDSCSPSKRWSVSSFPPQVSSALPPPISNGTSSSSGWGPGGGGGGGHPSARHSVTVSPFQDGGDSVISDLTSSWPTGIWSSPVPTSRQPQSPFSPSSSLPVRPPEDGWGVGGAGAQSDLVELMKSLDIAEHIPALKNRKLSLEQLCNLSEEGWRELNLPVGPRVKLMNAITNNKPLEAKGIGGVVEKDLSSSVPTSYVK